MGRGCGKLLLTDDNPAVTVGLKLSTSPPTLSIDSQDPFYIIITARILTTPHPEKAVTLAVDTNPFCSLPNRAFNNIVCTTKAGKFIKLISDYRCRSVWDPENMRSSFKFLTVPPPSTGQCPTAAATDTLEVPLEVPRSAIESANLQKGEKYRVSVSDKCLGTRWWSYGSLDELEGIRFVFWRSEEEMQKYEEDFNSDPDIQDKRRGYGDGPVTAGENQRMLALVREGEAEFEIV